MYTELAAELARAIERGCSNAIANLLNLGPRLTFIVRPQQFRSSAFAVGFFWMAYPLIKKLCAGPRLIPIVQDLVFNRLRGAPH